MKGSKSEIESAKSTYESIILSRLDFIEKWNDAKNTKLAAPNLLTDEFNNEFLITSCIPNSICDYQSPIWKKIVLTKQEISQLAQTFSTEIPSDVLLEFGNLEPELDSISFEYCLIEIQRPWFDESIINNKLWKYADQTIKVSEGDNTMTGTIPAYPVKLILSKNIELTFAANSPVNEDIKSKLKEGNRLFFGSLLLKTIPLNLANENIKTYKVQQLTTNELSVITKIAVQNSPTAAVNEKSKFRMIELLNKQPQTMLKKNVELKSIRPKIMMAQPVLVPRETVAAAVNPGTPKTMMVNRTAAFRTASIAPNRFVLNSGIVGPLPSVVTPPEPHVSSITGKIYDTNNKPVSTAEVQLMSNSNASTQSVLTGEDGTYNMVNIENGSYQLKIRKTGYIIQERKIDMVNNTNLDFVLEAEAVPTETFQVMGVICKKMPKLPNPLPDGVYI